MKNLTLAVFMEVVYRIYYNPKLTTRMEAASSLHWGGNCWAAFVQTTLKYTRKTGK